MVVQVFDEFSTGVEVLFYYLVFVLCTSSCSSLRVSVRVCFSNCFFHLLVSSKLDSYVVYAPA